MTPVDQTKFGPGVGNCFSACVASVLGIQLQDVPFFMHDWPSAFEAWLAEHGMRYAYFPARLWCDKNEEPFLGVPSGYSIMTGESPRHQGVFHSVVALDGAMVHDPHPSRAGVLGDQTWHDFIVIEHVEPCCEYKCMDMAEHFARTGDIP